MPDNYVFIPDARLRFRCFNLLVLPFMNGASAGSLLATCNPRRDPFAASGLHGMLACGVEFGVRVTRYPEGVSGEFGTPGVEGVRLGEEHLAIVWEEFVSDWGASDGINDVLVYNLEDAVACGVGV